MRIIAYLLLPLFIFLIEQVYADDVYITDIEIMPEHIRLNDTLTIKATIVNNSNRSISYQSLCHSPLSAEFSSNIAVEQGIGCLGFKIESIEPLANATVIGPASGIFYRVIDYGFTKMRLSFSYTLDNDQKSISKDLAFMIMEDGAKSVSRDEIFTLKINQSIIFDDHSITLIDVLDDSRCPIDVYCVWEGDARLLLAIKKGSKIENSNVTLHKPLLINGYVIKIKALEPERRIDAEIDPSDYKAYLTINKLELSSIKIKAYNQGYGLIGVLNFDKGKGFLAFFSSKRELLIADIEEISCNRLNAIICLDLNGKYIEISRDFIMIHNRYIPTIDLKLRLA